MATVTKNKYTVNKLPNTFYLVTKTEHFFSSKVEYDHAWYINNNWKGLGFHNANIEELNRKFVAFLNEPIYNTSIHIKEILSRSHMRQILEYLKHLVPTYIMFGYSFALGVGIHNLHNQFQGLEIETVNINYGNIPFIEIIPINASTFQRYRIGITEEERNCLIDFIRLSYLVELPRLTKKTDFYLNVNLNILDEAKVLGFCS